MFSAGGWWGLHSVYPCPTRPPLLSSSSTRHRRYVLTCSTVMTMFLSGEMTSGKVTLLLSMYFVFIVVVLIADIFHRTVTLPRQRAAAQRGIPGQAGGAYGAGGETTIEGGAIAMLNMLRTTFDERDDKEMAFGEVELDALGSSR